MSSHSEPLFSNDAKSCCAQLPVTGQPRQRAISIDHSGVAVEIGAPLISPVPRPGLATFVFATLAQLHAALDRVCKLAVSLPDAPLTRFQVKTAGLPRTTEAERLVIGKRSSAPGDRARLSLSTDAEARRQVNRLPL